LLSLAVGPAIKQGFNSYRINIENLKQTIQTRRGWPIACFPGYIRSALTGDMACNTAKVDPLNLAYRLLRSYYDHQHWWPGETPFEVCIGAILTQNTNWRNVERAIGNLKASDVLSIAKLHQLSHSELAAMIRPAGYYQVKAFRIRCFLDVLVNDYQGDLKALFAGATSLVRQKLLAINGIGPETADSMLLYAGGHLSFVVDAYTRRVFSRHGWAKSDASYEALRTLCTNSLNNPESQPLIDYWQDYHAQLVAVGKDFCRARKAQCLNCPLRPLLPQHVQNMLAPGKHPGI
jgi:endonuclease III related protein